MADRPSPPTPQVQATAADLSPLSPSPVHSVPPVSVPALQDTADLLDAMTEMPTAHDLNAGASAYAIHPPQADIHIQNIMQPPKNDDADSLGDAYEEQEDGERGQQLNAQNADGCTEDEDYLKSFDSPPQDVSQDDSSAQPREFNSQNSPLTQPSSHSTLLDAHRQSSQAQHPVATADASKPSPVSSAQQHTTLPTPVTSSDTPSTLTALATSSLPPKPPASEQASTLTRASDFHPQSQNLQSRSAASAILNQVSAGTAGGSLSTVDRLHTSAAPTQNQIQAPSLSTPVGEDSQWQEFLEDERHYVAEANWEQFPEGSRIFIGSRNLLGHSKTDAHFFTSADHSPDKVSKHDVFNIFRRYGRLAQVSLKSAYGFVQYHTPEAAQGAIRDLQGVEIKGRKIHLEVSRVQKKKGDDRSKPGERGREAGHKDRFDKGHMQRRTRDGTSCGGRDGGYGRSADHNGRHSQRRSRSPSSLNRGRIGDQYRRRSPPPPTPARSTPANEEQLDMPRRYGDQVPDVQFLLLQDVSRDFVSWVQQAFVAQGLRVDVVYLNPTFPRDVIVQRQAVEGVHAIVDLDFRAQTHGKVPLRVFDRSAGANVRFDDYQDLDPTIAAQLVQRTRAQASPVASHYQHHSGHQQYPIGGHPSQTYQPPANGLNAAGLERTLGHLDPATLHQVVAAVQASGYGGPQQQGSQPDVHSLISSMSGAQHVLPATNPHGSHQHEHAHGGHPGSYHGPPNPDPESAAQVNDIMAQLARFRQP